MELLVVIAVFAAIVAMLRFKVHISVALFLGGFLLTVVVSVTLLPETLVQTLSDVRTWYLMIMSFTVASFAELYRRTGLVESLGKGLASVLKYPALSLMIIPAVIGLMPVAGGALMSAPLVGVVGEAVGMSASMMVFANVWFRHTIFMFYPLSQIIITTSAMTGYSVEELALRQAPIAAIMIAAGLLIVSKELKGKGAVSVGKYEHSLKVSMTPLVVSLAAAIGLRQVMGLFGMPLGVALGVIVLLILTRPGPNEVVEALTDTKVLGITAAGFSIIFLQKAMVLSGATESIAVSVSSSGIHPLILEVLLPAAIGVMTGSPLTGIVMSIPVLQGLTQMSLSDVSLIYISSFVSYIGSPAHLCLVYTAQYFNQPMTTSYKYLIPAIAGTIAFAIIYLSFVA